MAGVLSTAAAEPSTRATDAKATLIEPVDMPHKHCAGSCISRGSLQWYCRPEQTCALNCSTAPPTMECTGGED